MDLDALEALRSDAVAKRAEAAQLFDVSYERYGEYRKTMERKARSAADAAYGASVDAFVVADKAARGAENALREAASDALPALITRLRAAEAAADANDIRARNGVAMLRRASKYIREDGAETPRSTRLARLVTQIDDLISRDMGAGAGILRAAEARTAWQPIETAPMTLDYILTHGPRGHVVTRYCSALGWVDEDDRDVYFTHWQPLPAPPASEVPRG